MEGWGGGVKWMIKGLRQISEEKRKGWTKTLINFSTKMRKYSGNVCGQALIKASAPQTTANLIRRRALLKVGWLALFFPSLETEGHCAY
ncbi:hypothetical protein CDAR_105081 [Caerostris darwini]|uniref:Uncharacterized protein n=1 Tax=Caerostris darwini TaxID=1538125 RepID=A0AAV4V5L0_9ARAC|nr:hypothetical protein CDAR_105081 [Caerostris darwini]